MDYKEKYEQSLEKARELMNNGYNVLMPEIFPELQEIADKKIELEIRNFIWRYPEKLPERYKWLAWFEKQSEKKPTDKVEPKFSVGDWIIQENIGVYKVIEVCESWYEVVDNKDKHYSIGFDKEYMCHLWTIEDAKEGDVLCDENDNIGLYSGEKDDLDWHSCIYLGCDGFIHGGFGIRGYHKYNNTKPATKEQRDSLFQKMGESGYEWDTKNKELKKMEVASKEIEDEEYNGEDYGIDSLWHAKNILEKTLGKVDGYQSDDGILDHKCAISAVKKLYEQKSVDKVPRR